jgi:hypothetical membrane protein
VLLDNRFRALPAFGLAIVVFGLLAIGALHVLPPTSAVSPIRRTISEYALHETGWIFNLGVAALALGSFAVFIALTRAGLTRPGSWGAIGLSIWSLGLAGVVYFPKHNWSVGPSISGDIHRVASLAAFIALPIGAIAIAWQWRRHALWSRYAKWTLASAFLALAFFSVLLGAVALQPVTGVRWWRAIPLGAVERGLGAAEVMAVLALGWWSVRAHRSPIVSSSEPVAAASPSSGS